MSDSKFLIVTIDVECDKTPTWHTQKPVSFRGVLDAIPNKLQPLFETFGIRPTYLLSPEVIARQECTEVLKQIQACELGAHLHGEYILPRIKTWDLGGTITDEMQCEYPPELEKQKLQVLTALFFQQIGSRPASFRAGRFGIGHDTGKWLLELGYRIDTSVTPHVTWTNRKAEPFTNFNGFHERPYRVSEQGDLWQAGCSNLLEIPVTILDPTSKIENGSSHGPVWFRPWYSDTATLCKIVQYVAREPSQHRRPLVMMFHNVELIPGASPYPQTDEQVSKYLRSLSEVFHYAISLGFSPCTLSEYYAHHEQTDYPVLSFQNTTD